MNELTLGNMITGIALCTSVCSLASFYFGRQKAIAAEAREEGHLTTDLQYIKETIRDTTKSLDALTVKLDAQNKQREDDYRQLLVKLTELKASYKSLHLRVDNLEQQVDRYHHSA